MNTAKLQNIQALFYAAIKIKNTQIPANSGVWWRRSGSNRLPLECHSSARPGELRPHILFLLLDKYIILYFTTQVKIIILQTKTGFCFAETGFIFNYNILYDVFGWLKLTECNHAENECEQSNSFTKTNNCDVL